MGNDEFDTKQRLAHQLDVAESELAKAFDRVVRSDHPNLERKGCPGATVLQQLAASPESFDDQQTLTHIGQCAPCLDELRKLRQAFLRRTAR